MFTPGWMDDGLSRLPTRTTLNCGRVLDLAKRCVPQLEQNWRVISLPLFATFTCSDKGPEWASAEVGTSMFTVPFAARCWQSRHQQTRTASGSTASVKVTAPHKHCPVR